MSHHQRTRQVTPWKAGSPPKSPQLIVGLVDARLEGAACRGRAPLFDDRVDGETDQDRILRHRYAVNICSHCPVIRACQAAADDHHSEGIWSGRRQLIYPNKSNRSRQHPKETKSA
ncbi:WhiB family transcriptional regulator [Rhodococcus sp. NPDC056960]|uniref:WhiB family transcriptional regulator n=1 Tax=Rhodococcus sp. NPDC056960 TaxID=3345982 RepID=UPI00363910E8